MFSLPHTAAIMVCGPLTPTAFVSTFSHNSCAAFSHRGYEKEDKDELSRLWCSLNHECKDVEHGRTHE